MEAFHVNACVRGLDGGEVLAVLRRQGTAGFAGPTEDGWTALVAEDLDMRDGRVIAAYGESLTRDPGRVAIVFLCHDEDVLWVGLHRDGREVGELNSAPAYFHDRGEFDPDTGTFEKPPPTEEEARPVLRGAEAFADAFGLDAAAVAGLMPRGFDEGPIELHERWSETLGLPAYAVAMGFRRVESGESDVEWARA